MASPRPSVLLRVDPECSASNGRQTLLGKAGKVNASAGETTNPICESGMWMAEGEISPIPEWITPQLSAMGPRQQTTR